ncbi:hypothetical protein HDZ31DRAFT_41468 [Schizophyllum fasciatum]
MPSREVLSILDGALGNLCPDNAPAILSSILHVFFRERARPLDPDYVSEHACSTLLRDNPGLYPLLARAVTEHDDSILEECDMLDFRAADLRTRRPETREEAGAETELEGLLARHRASISAFANATSPPEMWTPPQSATSTPFSEFISSLGFIKTKAEMPCLLLQNLHIPSTPTASAVLSQVFVPGQNVILVNASGSGKTRLIYEGLCHRWGFYIPCALDRNYLGSLDMSNCLDEGISRKRGFQRRAPWTEWDMQYNRTLAHETFTCILLSRLVVFKTFLEVLSGMNSPRGCVQWLLLQILTLRLAHGDIFDCVTTILLRFSPAYINAMVADILLDIKAKLGRTDIYCVLDDCQRANDLYRGAYGEGTTTLGELARCWEKYEGINLVFSGTKVDLLPLQDHGHDLYKLYSPSATFPSADAQRAYILRYLPPSLADTGTTEELTKRAWLWLRGRYVFSSISQRKASSEKCVDIASRLPTGLPAPLTALKKLKPASAKIVRNLWSFDCASIGGDIQTWLAVQSALFKLMLTGRDCVRFEETCPPLVAHGVAPFIDTGGKEVLVHEPVAALSLGRAVFPESDVGLGFFPDARMSSLREQPTHRTYYLAFAVALVQALRAEQYSLSELFDFPDIAPDWAQEPVELVRITRGTGGRKSRATTFEPSFSNIRRADSWATDTPEWLLHDTSTPFCMASSFSQADLLFVMRLASGRCLNVALAALLNNEHLSATPEDVQAKLSQLAPDNIFRVRRHGMPDARFGDLPHNVHEAGDPPLLRLVAIYPFEMNVHEIQPDGVPQPFAIVKSALLRESALYVSQGDILRRLRAVMTVPSLGKRKRSAVDLNEAPERPRTRSMTKKMQEEGGQGGAARGGSSHARRGSRQAPAPPRSRGSRRR